MVEAALTALNSNSNENFKKTAQTAFEWYHGRNTQEVTFVTRRRVPVSMELHLRV